MLDEVGRRWLGQDSGSLKIVKSTIISFFISFIISLMLAYLLFYTQIFWYHFSGSESIYFQAIISYTYFYCMLILSTEDNEYQVDDNVQKRLAEDHQQDECTAQ